jgi:hypothetical protein
VITCRTEPLSADSFDHHFRRFRLDYSRALSPQVAIVSSALVGKRDRDLRRRNIDRVGSHIARLATGIVQGLIHCRGAARSGGARHRHNLSFVRQARRARRRSFAGRCRQHHFNLRHSFAGADRFSRSEDAQR